MLAKFARIVVVIIYLAVGYLLEIVCHVLDAHPEDAVVLGGRADLCPDLRGPTVRIVRPIPSPFEFTPRIPQLDKNNLGI